LLKNVQITGAYLKDSLFDVQRRFPNLVKNVRGQGIFLAFDLPDTAAQGKLLGTLRQKGVEATGSGATSIRFRPMLIFTPDHADIFLNILESSLKTL